MDMNPITVLGANAAAKPSSSSSTGAAKEPFAQVLSAHQGPEAKASARETKRAHADSDDGKKNTAKKAETSAAEVQDQNVQEGEAKPAASPAIVTVAPAPNVPLDLSLTSLGLVGAKPSAEATKETQALDSTQKPTPKDLDKPVSLRDLLAVRTFASSKESIGTQSVVAPKGQAKTSQRGSPVKGTQADSVDSKIEPGLTEVRAKVQPTAVENRRDAVEQENVLKTLGTVTTKQDPPKADNPAGEKPAVPAAATSATAAPATTTTSATAPMASLDADADQPASALKAAAEKIGAVISATAHAGSQTPASRSQVSAIKAAVAPEKIGAVAMPQVAGTGATRHDDSQKHGDQANTAKRDGSFAEVSAQTTDSKVAGQEVAPEAAASASSTNKAGAAQSSAASNPHAVTSQSASEGQPGRAESANAGVRQNANPLPISAANSEATLDFGAWSKTSLIEKFRQSEMQFGMQAGEFGRIEVRTVLDRHEVTARISVERGDLGKALESELPGLQKRLSDLDVPVGKITLHEQSAAMSGESGRRSREQQWTNSQPLPQQQKMEFVPKATIFAEQSISTEGLSIRI